MDIMIRIDCENQAFKDGNMENEIRRILDNSLRNNFVDSLETSQKLFDLLGNPVGEILKILNNSEAIEQELLSNFTCDEFRQLSFEELWDQVDVQNAYEDGWEDLKDDLKSYYQEAYNNIREELAL